MRLTIVANDFLWLLLLLAAAPAYRAPPNSGHRWGPGTSGSSGTSGPAWYMRGGGTLAVGLAWGGYPFFYSFCLATGKRQTAKAKGPLEPWTWTLESHGEWRANQRA